MEAVTIAAPSQKRALIPAETMVAEWLEKCRFNVDEEQRQRMEWFCSFVRECDEYQRGVPADVQVAGSVANPGAEAPHGIAEEVNSRGFDCSAAEGGQSTEELALPVPEPEILEIFAKIRGADARDYMLKVASSLFDRAAARVSVFDVKNVREKIARALHYPECWDTVAFPSLESAAWETISWANLTCRFHASNAPEAKRRPLYVFLVPGDEIRATDQRYSPASHRWVAIAPLYVGSGIETNTRPVRRLVSPAVVPAVAPAATAAVSGVPTLWEAFEMGFQLRSAMLGHVLDGRDVGRLTTCDFWHPSMLDMHEGTDLHVGLTVTQAIVRLKTEVRRRMDLFDASRACATGAVGGEPAPLSSAMAGASASASEPR